MEQKQPNDDYEFFAFISYNNLDIRWGWRLKRKLEGYLMPASLRSERNRERLPKKRRVFLAPSDIQPGILPVELQNKLSVSQNLIVICSPNSAKSEWVGYEISYFHSLGRTDRIYLFIVEGTPHSRDPKTECFHPILKKLKLPDLLGANIHENAFEFSLFNHLPWAKRERAYIQLISKLLGVSFDSIWRRHRKLLIFKIICWAVGAILMIATLITVWQMNRPVDVSVQLKEMTPINLSLPPFDNAIVGIDIGKEIKVDTVLNMDDKAIFHNIPHRFLGKTVNVRVTCRDFLGMDTPVILEEENCISLVRDTSVYGTVHFQLWQVSDECPLANTRVCVGKFETSSDENGYVDLQIPIMFQEPVYVLSADVPLADSLLYMPCNKHSVIRVLTP